MNGSWVFVPLFFLSACSLYYVLYRCYMLFYGASLRDEEYERLSLGAIMKEAAERDARSFDDQGDEE